MVGEVKFSEWFVPHPLGLPATRRPCADRASVSARVVVSASSRRCATPKSPTWKVNQGEVSVGFNLVNIMVNGQNRVNHYNN